jgi:hypothetical protein
MARKLFRDLACRPAIHFRRPPTSGCGVRWAHNSAARPDGTCRSLGCWNPRCVAPSCAVRYAGARVVDANALGLALQKRFAGSATGSRQVAHLPMRRSHSLESAGSAGFPSRCAVLGGARSYPSSRTSKLTDLTGVSPVKNDSDRRGGRIPKRTRTVVIQVPVDARTPCRNEPLRAELEKLRQQRVQMKSTLEQIRAARRELARIVDHHPLKAEGRPPSPKRS